MARLELRFDKPNLGNDLRLGVVAHVRQIKDASGQFPEEPQDHEVVIPAGLSATKTVDNLPPGTYRIEARLPSGQVLRETREVTDEQATQDVVFTTGHSPHEWLSLQRLAGNVPSEAQYEDWVNKIAAQIDEFAKAKDKAGKPFEIDPATLQGWARFLHGAHVRIQPLIKSFNDMMERRRKAAAGAPDSNAARETTSPVAAAPPEFKLIMIDEAVPPVSMWDAAASVQAWMVGRVHPVPEEWLTFERFDDRQITLWKIVQQQRDRAVVDGGPFPRRSFAVMQRGDGMDVIPLPVPWPLNPNILPATLEILREAGTSESGRTTLTVRDEFVGSLIMYLSNGRIADAATVLAEVEREGMIEELISDKLDNPFAACAAAYVGFATLTPGESAPRWTNWLQNLTDLFAWLPDGAVIQAAYLLKTAKVQADLDAARDTFKTAYGRGVPFYTAGLQHLLNGLYMFSGSDDEAKAMHEKVAAVACRVDPMRAFTQITIPAQAK